MSLYEEKDEDELYKWCKQQQFEQYYSILKDSMEFTRPLDFKYLSDSDIDNITKELDMPFGKKSKFIAAIKQMKDNKDEEDDRVEGEKNDEGKKNDEDENDEDKRNGGDEKNPLIVVPKNNNDDKIKKYKKIKDLTKDDINIIAKKINFNKKKLKTQHEQNTKNGIVPLFLETNNKNNYSNIFLFGRTGCGKSHLANRLFLNFGPLSDGADFLCYRGNEYTSMTTTIQAEYIIYNLSHVIGIIDVPGLDDSEGRDADFLTRIFKYFMKIGLCKQIIVIPLKLNDVVLDATFQACLYLLSILYSKQLWCNLYFVINYVDGNTKYPEILQGNLQSFEERKAGFITKLKTDFGKYGCEHVNVISMGENNHFNSKNLQILLEAARNAKQINGGITEKIIKYQLTKNIAARFKIGAELVNEINNQIKQHELKEKPHIIKQIDAKSEALRKADPENCDCCCVIL